MTATDTLNPRPHGAPHRMSDTTPTCRICQAETDATICDNCTIRLEQTIAELPSLVHDLEVTVTRQARLAHSGRTTAAPPELAQADREQRRVPAQLRSREGRITLPTTDMPFAEAAANLYSLAVQALDTWAQHLARTRGLPLDLARTPIAGPLHNRCDHPSCARIRTQRLNDRQHHITRLCTWLVAHINDIRHDPAAARMHRRLTKLVDRITATIDRRLDEELFAGRCTERVITVDLDQDEQTLIPRVDDECGTDLYAKLGETKVECPTCGATYDLEERRSELRRSVANAHARPHDIANALTRLDEPVKPETLRKWIERDRHVMEQLRAGTRRPPAYPLILEAGVDDTGHALYRVGDVQARVTAMRERNQPEARRTP